MESVRLSFSGARRWAGMLLLGLVATTAQAQVGDYVDPPGRIAYLSDSAGRVSFSPAGDEAWLDVHRNRPLINGDRLWTDRDARAEVQVGSAFLRLGSESAFEILALDDEFAQFELTEGVLQLNVRRLLRGQAYEIATPNLAFVVDRVGRYRVEVDPYRDETTLVVWHGGGEAWGDGGSFGLREGEAVVFRGTDLRDYRIYGLPREDAFDLYCLDRDRLIDRSPTLRYVDDELAGYASLDAYGSWRNSSEYGAVWYPTRVDADWAPYRDGHWVYQSPWGWTWVDNAPWGFAPSHYGRWVYVSNRWGWVPGPRHVRPVYAPALVVFVGGDRWQAALSYRDRSPIGWFPLGPRDVYVPSYRVSRDYFSRVNVHNTVVNVTVINNIYVEYARGADYGRRIEYAHGGRSSAFTVVPRETFTSARDVRREAFRLERNLLANARFSGSVDYAPDRRAVRGATTQSRSAPDRGVFERGVIARTPPAFSGFGVPDAQPRQGAGRGTGPAQTSQRGQPAQAAPDNVRVIGDQRRAADVRRTMPQRGAATEGRALPDRADRVRAPDAQRGVDARGRERESRQPEQRPQESGDRRRESSADQLPTRSIKEEAERQRLREAEAASRQRDDGRRFEAEARQREAERERQQAESLRQQRLQDDAAARQREAEMRGRDQRDAQARDQRRRDELQREQSLREREAVERQRESDRRAQDEARQRESEERARMQREQAEMQRGRQMRDQAEAEARQRENAARMEAQREREAAERQRQAEQQAEARQRDAEARERAQRDQDEIQRQRLEQTRAEAEARQKANEERRAQREEERRRRNEEGERDDE